MNDTNDQEKVSRLQGIFQEVTFWLHSLVNKPYAILAIFDWIVSIKLPYHQADSSILYLKEVNTLQLILILRVSKAPLI